MGHSSAAPQPEANGSDTLETILERIARGDPADLGAVLASVEKDALIDGTKISVHTHCLALGPTKKPNVAEFAKQLAQYVTEYAIPQTRIREAYDHQARTRTSNQVNLLKTEASTLFTEIGNSGEGGELILFVLGEVFLKLPQLICKMDLKTSTSMHYHGADGLHVGAEGDSLILYWGESKIHEDPIGAIRDCLASLAPLLNGPGGLGSAEERDIQLLQRGIDFNDPELECALKAFLDPKNPKYNTTEFRGLCLVGFNESCYPEKPNTVKLDAVMSSIAAEIPKWKKQIKKRAKVEGIETFAMHFFCLPFPSIDEFRLNFRKALGISG